MFNPNVRFAKSKGIDLPLMYIYLAGFMAKDKLKECTEWRLNIRNHYRNWEYDHETEEQLAFPICILDPFNGKEIETISPKGVTSSIPPHAIRRGDKMSVVKADIIIANMNTFGCDRPMIGTHHELRWAGDMEKPRILIVSKKDLELYQNHPFTADCDYFFTSTEEMLEAEVVESFYKRIAGAVYEIPKGDL